MNKQTHSLYLSHLQHFADDFDLIRNSSEVVEHLETILSMFQVSGRILPATFGLVDTSFNGLLSDTHFAYIGSTDGSSFNQCVW